MLAVAEKILFILVLTLSLFLALSEIRRKYRLILRGRRVDRFDHPLQRVGEMLRKVLLQIPVISRRPVSGFFHALIFWGFFVFLLVTLNHAAEGFLRGLALFGHGAFSRIVFFGANLFAGLILLAVVYFLIRRYVFRPAGLDLPSYQSLTVLTLIFVLMVSFLFYEAFKMYGEPAAGPNFLVGWVFRNLLPAPGVLPAGAVQGWIHVLWWLHILVIMGFGVFIFYSKHLHLVAGPLNLLFSNRGVKAEIPLVDLEEQEKFGTPEIRDLTRKDLIDLFSCAECGRCDDVCPALQSGKVLSPKKLLNKLKENLLESEGILNAGEGELKKLLGEVVSEEELWDCTTCAACMEVCPMLNEHIPKITGIRQYGVLTESRFPEELNALFKGLENQGNPWGINADTRVDWARELAIPLMSEKRKADVLFWVGCAGSFDLHSQKIVKAMAELLKRATVDFAILGNEERCCGDPARRSGMEYLFQIMARQNIEILNQYQFGRIVTVCPHGYHSLKNEYPRMGGNYDVRHHSEFLLDLLKSGKLALDRTGKDAVVFHDPCYLGRYNGLYEEPREVLRKSTGIRLREMKRRRSTSFCCGAGGGGMWKEEKTGERISHMRARQAQKTGAGTLVTACPFCSIMFKDAIAETDIQNLKTADLAQIVLENLKP